MSIELFNTAYALNANPEFLTMTVEELFAEIDAEIGQFSDAWEIVD